MDGWIMGGRIDGWLHTCVGAYTWELLERPDADTGHSDANIGHPDANTGHPDADMGHPDAHIGHPDANIGHPDADRPAKMLF